MVEPLSVAPAAGDVNLTSAKTKGTSATRSQVNRRIMAVVSAGEERWGDEDEVSILLPSIRSHVVDV